MIIIAVNHHHQSSLLESNWCLLNGYTRWTMPFNQAFVDASIADQHWGAHQTTGFEFVVVGHVAFFADLESRAPVWQMLVRSLDKSMVNHRKAVSGIFETKGRGMSRDLDPNKKDSHNKTKSHKFSGRCPWLTKVSVQDGGLLKVKYSYQLLITS